MKAENPKVVFQAMRPVFSDIVAEIQRSIGFFTSNNRNAKLGEIVALGNPMKLPGLQRFLSQNLDQQVKTIDQFNNLVGGTATAGPQFKENQLTFGVAYGLCVQALDSAQLRTNLLPDEIVTTRLVRAKKPWAVAAVALLLVGLTINYFSHYAALLTANTDDPSMKQAIAAAKNIATLASGNSSKNSDLITQFDKVVTTAQNLQSNVDGRLLWLEMLKGINAALPQDPRPLDKRQDTEEDIAKRDELHIEGMECEYMPDLTNWRNFVQKWYTPPPKPKAAAPVNAAGTPATPADAAAQAIPPAGQVAPTADPNVTPSPDAAAAANSGWVVELRGYHLHNSIPGKVNVGDEGEEFIKNTFFKNLETGTVKLPDGPGGKPIDVRSSDLGITMPVVVTHPKIQSVEYYPEASDNTTAGPAMLRGPEAPGAVPIAAAQPGEQLKTYKLRKYRFIIQFCWQPQPRSLRLQKMAQKKAAAPSTAATGGEATPPNS
ncbi:MAG TPA: pilus assembly protein PilM, partial [Lacipirellulaceae bacterium]|nr:pilus assembly protein PilM [Lacipirellulaceae bacterium]